MHCTDRGRLLAYSSFTTARAVCETSDPCLSPACLCQNAFGQDAAKDDMSVSAAGSPQLTQPFTIQPVEPPDPVPAMLCVEVVRACGLLAAVNEAAVWLGGGTQICMYPCMPIVLLSLPAVLSCRCIPC